MNQHKNNSHYLINMSSELLNALIYEHPIVNNLQKKIKKLEKKNMKLDFKKKNWKKKYNAILAILHDYPSISYREEVSSKRRSDVIDLTDDNRYR